MPTTMKGPGLFLAQFAGDAAPFNSLASITKWAAGLGYKGVQIPTWDARLFDEFTAFYLTGFADLVEGGLRLRPEGITAFYPSTVYVDTRPAELTEYAMSKAAGEVLCADLPTQLRGLRIVARRLPRLPTDQTNSLVPVDTVDPLFVMLPLVRETQQQPAKRA